VDLSKGGFGSTSGVSHQRPWTGRRRAPSEYERVKRVVEEILAEKYALLLHLRPGKAQEKRKEAG